MQWSWIIAAIFLPLFPLSGVFVKILGNISNARMRAAILLIWPQFALFFINSAEAAQNIPLWLQIWAAVTALLYAFRTLVLRDVTLWTGYIAVSCWSLAWLVLTEKSPQSLTLYLLGFSLPLSLMALLRGELEQRFEAAYSGLVTGLAVSLPKMAGLLVMAVLAITATPIFPGFFSLLGLIIGLTDTTPWLAVGVLLVWFLWAWSGMRLLQGLLTGESSERQLDDMNYATAGFYLFLMVCLGVFGLYSARGF